MTEPHDPGGARQSLIDDCEQLLEYSFRDHGLLQCSLTHASAAPARLESNERLEFLGDAVLGTLICETIYRRFPKLPEGELTQLKSSLVSRATCAKITEQLGIDRCLIIGKGLRAGHGLPSSILAGLFESILGAVYLDGGIEAARRLVARCFAPEIEDLLETDSTNFKSALQQLSQKRSGKTPVYRTVDEQGPDHAKCFQVAAVVGCHSYPAAWGPSKKEAEQLAARNALSELDNES